MTNEKRILLEDFKKYVYDNFDFEFSCEDTMLLTNLEDAKQKVFNWIGQGYKLGCCCNCKVTEVIFKLAYYYSNAGYMSADVNYNETLKQQEMTAFLTLKNAGIYKN